MQRLHKSHILFYGVIGSQACQNLLNHKKASKLPKVIKRFQGTQKLQNLKTCSMTRLESQHARIYSILNKKVKNKVKKLGVGTVRFGSKLSRTDLNRLFYKKNRIRTELNNNRTQTVFFGSVRFNFFGSCPIGPILNF